MKFPVLSDIGFTLAHGRSLGVIGESGSGKSTLARVIAGLTPLAAGTIRLNGDNLPTTLVARTKDQLRRIQIVFQMADTALNPRVTVADIIGRPLTFYFGLRGGTRQARASELLDLTQLPRIGRSARGPAICRRPKAARSISRARWPQSRMCCCATRSPRRWTPLSAPQFSISLSSCGGGSA